ncbi:HEAT repeat domain-containing protein [Paenibacillus wynnii]|uniref:HEAT repeat domain-containing protein n=1 Tax=Paenibacillus wynnii TaxID=268407 RepID=A0A098M2V0_9BACL|nr:hypothetical protein [Paenibacillus wynnii]KGE16789.1 hypothetical protein PWYN_19025 [Paenibacillus wynnii]
MSKDLLQELHQEVRRLYIAGSDLAPGDFRLKRLLPQFEQLGTRAPIFKKLGEGITELLESSEGQGQETAIKLQNLTSLLGSVLRTQGSTTPDGVSVDLSYRPINLSTSFSYRKLAQVQRALTTTGSGRYEIVTEAFAQGIFRDLRLFPLAIKALDDPYVEIAEFAKDKILPAYGQPIVPHLLEIFNPSGSKSEVRKLQVIRKVGGTEVLGVIYNAAENGTDDIRVEAIKCLSGFDEYVQALLQWTKSKKKVIREAAYEALASGGTLLGRERLYEAFLGNDRGLVAEALVKWPSPQLTEQLSPLFMAELKQAPIETDDKKKCEAVFNTIGPFITALEEQRNKQLDEIYSYVVKEYKQFLALGWIPLIDQAALYLEKTGSMEALELLQVLEKQNLRYFPHYFRAARMLMSPKDIYNHFTGNLIDKLKSFVSKSALQREKQLLETLETQVMHCTQLVYEVPPELDGGDTHYTLEMMSAEEISTQWDPRWLDWLIERDSMDLVCAFARPGHKAAEEYILNKLHNEPIGRKNYYSDDVKHVLMGLERTGMEESERLELLMTVLENRKRYHPYMFDYYLFDMMLRFPISYISRIEAAATQHKYEASRQLEVVSRHLHNKSRI